MRIPNENHRVICSSQQAQSTEKDPLLHAVVRGAIQQLPSSNWTKVFLPAFVKLFSESRMDTVHGHRQFKTQQILSKRQKLKRRGQIIRRRQTQYQQQKSKIILQLYKNSNKCNRKFFKRMLIQRKLMRQLVKRLTCRSTTIALTSTRTPCTRATITVIIRLLKYLPICSKKIRNRQMHY